ncbi:MAG: phosphoglucosamine mutase [Verrucomicrobiota bacterium]
MGELFGTDGIRGEANRYPITPEVALRVGKAVAKTLGELPGRPKRIVIGKDTRLSGYMLETALTSGLVSMGMDVYLVGPVPTPAVAHLTRSMAACGGIMLTASHNPYNDNGIKIFDRDGFKLSDELEMRIEHLVFGNELRTDHLNSKDIGKAQRVEDARGRYIEFAKSTINNQGLEDLNIVLDCANGATYLIGPWIFRELGATVTKTHVDPDGYNINQDCGATHPEAVANAVKEHGADIGIAFDGDGDRVLFADNRGQVIEGDRILLTCALDFKRRGLLRNDTLVVTSMSNLGLHDAAAKHGIHVEVTDVGDRYVIERMREKNHALGGENSGHLIFSDYATTGDGIISALQVLRLMKETGRPLAELADVMDEYPQKLVSVPVVEKPPLDELAGVQSVATQCREALGENGRLILRYSGTEHKLRVLIEARTEEDVERWTAALVEAINREIGT